MYIPGTSYKITWYRVFFSLYVILYLFFWIHTPKHASVQAQLTPYQAEHITKIQTGKTTPEELVYFACSLAGTPYKFGSTDPSQGLDCSGLVTYVFNHFGIMVPRVSVDFTNVQHEVPIQYAKMGDLILFTGTDSTERVVGHMGIISSMPGEPLRFIHSTSGKGYGVTETDFYDHYYESRFVKVIRVFPQNEPKISNTGE
jgi:murein DD-endopeptidase / murein LD-carboxypeptidase